MQHTSYSRQDLLCMAGLAIVYALLAKFVLTTSTANGNITIFWLPGGFALAALLICGRKLWPAVFLGATVAGITVNDPLSVSIFLAAGNTLETLFAAYLCHRLSLDPNFQRPRDFLILAAVGMSCAIISALIGPLSLLAAGFLNWQNITNNIFHWWQGDTLGILLSTPLFLIWRKFPHHWFARQKIAETLAFIGLTILTGQIVFLGWFDPMLGHVAKGYLMFLFIAWGTTRFNQHGATLVLCITAIQALFGATHGVGYFAQDIAISGLQNFWLYLFTLTVVGITLGVFVDSRMRAEIALRIAAIAFESKNGIFVTDAKTTIIRVNSALTKITGFSTEEIVGKPARILVADHHDDDFYAQMWQAINTAGFWTGELSSRRKDGESYSEHLSITAVKDDTGMICNYVGTMMDMTNAKQLEQQRLNQEIALRTTLVREVHHRIKNSLQGVTSLLRQTLQKNPELHDTIIDVISQVRSIALTHGLQGKNAQSQVILQDLVLEIAANNQMLWHHNFTVDISPELKSWKVNEEEAVPLALVLNELALNAIKHHQPDTEICIAIMEEPKLNSVLITFINHGQLSSETGAPNEPNKGTGLSLVDLLLPESATLTWEQKGERVIVRLSLKPPAISIAYTEIYK